VSLSDYVKYLRAVGGGLTPWEIAEKSGVTAREIHLIEVKHRRVGDNEEVLQKLANFFNVPLESLIDRREAYRKRLTFFLEENQQQSSPVVLKLENGEELEGTVAWFGREALAIVPVGSDSSDNPYVVQRGWVADWRRGDSPEWEVATPNA
jgi:transcriptional regulator with XRE-family HTH domain